MSDRNRRSFLDQAREARSRGEHALAADLSRQAIAENPRNAAAHVELAAALRLLGRLDAAHAAIGRALARDPALPSAYMEAARIALARGDQAAARSAFEQAAALRPGWPQPLLELAAAARQAGDLATACDAARRAAHASPDNAAAWKALAAAERAFGNRAGAREAYVRAAALKPEDPAPHLALAALAIEARNPAVAREALAAARAAGGEAAALAIEESRLAMLEGRPAAAIEHLQTAIAQEPANPQARTLLVHAALAAGRMDVAETALAERLALGGEAQQLLLLRTSVLRRGGRPFEALSCLRAAIAAGEGRFAVVHTAARLALQFEGPAAARALLAGLAPQGPAQEAELARLRSAIAEAEGAFPEAVAEAEAALAAEPEDAPTLETRARLATLLFDEETALNALRRQAAAEASFRRARGRAHAPSQSFTGQIANEFRLDQELREALAPLLALPPAERLAPLGRLVAEVPESTPAALWFLLSLRQAGCFATPPSGPPAIPPTLLWLGEAQHARMRDAWVASDPSLSVVSFASEAEAAAFLAEHFGAAGRTAWRRAERGEPRSDLLRVCWLAARGGWVAGGDTLPGEPLQQLPIGGAAIVAGQGLWGAPVRSLIGAAPGSPVFALAADTLLSALARGDREHPWLLGGPGLLARVLAQAIVRYGLAETGVFLLPEHSVNRVAIPGCLR